MIALLVLETAMIGTFAALDLVLFYVFWELMQVVRPTRYARTEYPARTGLRLGILPERLTTSR